MKLWIVKIFLPEEGKEINCRYKADTPHEAAEKAVNDFMDEGVTKYNIVSVIELNTHYERDVV